MGVRQLRAAAVRRSNACRALRAKDGNRSQGALALCALAVPGNTWTLAATRFGCDDANGLPPDRDRLCPSTGADAGLVRPRSGGRNTGSGRGGAGQRQLWRQNGGRPAAGRQWRSRRCPCSRSAGRRRPLHTKERRQGCHRRDSRPGSEPQGSAEPGTPGRRRQERGQRDPPQQPAAQPCEGVLGRAHPAQ